MLTGACHCGACVWTLDGGPGAITACNCTLCRRYGVLWAYGYEGEGVHVAGPTSAYARSGEEDPMLEVCFCPTCACVVCWRGLRLHPDGRRRMAVNIRLAEPEVVGDLPVDHFDGLHTFKGLPSDGACVRDLWF